jgi:eukaryotic-like serine/threonine-protein kinase
VTLHALAGSSGSGTVAGALTGCTLGRYELVRPLARGGMAELYLARRRSGEIEKWLVVKCMRPEIAGDPRFVDMFVREARLAMQLVHRNIVPVFDFGKAGDQLFLVMERVDGHDLGVSLAHARACMPPVVAAHIASECCQALDYVHRRTGPDGTALGVVHRDVTPRNVLLSWSGEVVLADFGIAAVAGDAARRPLGTPQYMAPEQARREPLDPRADLYTTGLVLREAITGDPGHAVPVEVPALAAIVARATAACPADRYPDARAMLDDLDRFLVAQRAAHRDPPPARQLAAWLARVWADEPAEPIARPAASGRGFDGIGTGTVRSMAATGADLAA